jgi:hypothetical protein
VVVLWYLLKILSFGLERHKLLISLALSQTKRGTSSVTRGLVIRQAIPGNGIAMLVPRLQEDGVIFGYLWASVASARRSIAKTPDSRGRRLHLRLAELVRQNRRLFRKPVPIAGQVTRNCSRHFNLDCENNATPPSATEATIK